MALPQRPVTPLPPPLVASRRALCRGCHCDLDPADPCARCPEGRWTSIFCCETPGIDSSDPTARPRPELGDLLARALAALGITKPRYRALKALLGLKPSCGCAARQAWLNRLGRRIRAWLPRPLRADPAHTAPTTRATAPNSRNL